MRLRTFTASDMPSAMKMVRDELGENAIILSTDSNAARRQVSVTAAVEEVEEEEQPVSSLRGGVADVAIQKEKETGLLRSARNDEAISNIRFELQEILRFHNLPEILIAKLLKKISDEDIASCRPANYKSALEKLLSRSFVFDPLHLSAANLRIMLVGTAGIGKTLTIAKLATKLAMEKHAVAVITTDNTRAGGVEQLQAFTDILGLELHIASGRRELEIILKNLPAKMRVLIDTAGAAPYDEGEIAELKALATLPDIEPILTLPAGGDSLEAIDIVEAFRELPVRRILVTRADATRRFGGILAAAAAHGLGFCNISRSASITDIVQLLEPSILAQLLLKYKG